MLRRPPTRRETIWSVLSLVLVALLGAYSVLFQVDWQSAPVRGGIAIGLMALGIITQIPLLRADVADPPANLGLIDVERSARWPLRRELWAGRPGPVELRRYAVGWATRKVKYPMRGSVWFWLAGWSLAYGAGARAFPIGVLDWVYVAVVAVMVISGVASFVLLRQAERVIDKIEQEAAADQDEVTADR